MDDKRDMLSISEMAKLRQITPETLRHYDRIGLFRPSYIDPESGYRYYSITQYEDLGTIVELRQLGMSLEEISEYYKNRTLDRSVDLLKKRLDILKMEIEEKQKLEEIIESKMRFLQGMQENQNIGVVFEEHLGERYMLTYGDMGVNMKQMCLDITKLEGHMKEIAPVFATDRVGAYSIADVCGITSDFKFAPFIMCGNAYKESVHYKVIPAGRYVSVYYNGRFGRYNDIFIKLKDYLNTHKLRQNGWIYQTYEIDITVTSNFDETLILLQVPVENLS